MTKVRSYDYSRAILFSNLSLFTIRPISRSCSLSQLLAGFHISQHGFFNTSEMLELETLYLYCKWYVSLDALLVQKSTITHENNSQVKLSSYTLLRIEDFKDDWPQGIVILLYTIKSQLTVSDFCNIYNWCITLEYHSSNLFIFAVAAVISWTWWCFYSFTVHHRKSFWYLFLIASGGHWHHSCYYWWL